MQPSRAMRAGGSAAPAQEAIEPAAVVTAMALAVARVRRMAVTVFLGDAALFAGATSSPARPSSGPRRF